MDFRIAGILCASCPATHRPHAILNVKVYSMYPCLFRYYMLGDGGNKLVSLVHTTDREAWYPRSHTKESLASTTPGPDLNDKILDFKLMS